MKHLNQSNWYPRPAKLALSCWKLFLPPPPASCKHKNLHNIWREPRPAIIGRTRWNVGKIPIKSQQNKILALQVPGQGDHWDNSRQLMFAARDLRLFDDIWHFGVLGLFSWWYAIVHVLNAINIWEIWAPSVFSHQTRWQSRIFLICCIFYLSEKLARNNWL